MSEDRPPLEGTATPAPLDPSTIAALIEDHRELLRIWGILVDAGSVTTDAQGVRQLVEERDRLLTEKEWWRSLANHRARELNHILYAVHSLIEAHRTMPLWEDEPPKPGSGEGLDNPHLGADSSSPSDQESPR